MDIPQHAPGVTLVLNKNNMKTTKTKFFGELYFNKPLPGLGSVVSYRADDLAAVVARLRYYAKVYNKPCSAVIRLYDGQEWITVSKPTYSELMK